MCSARRCHCAQASDEFVTELDVSELAPVELESGLDEDGEVGDWSGAWQEEGKSKPAGQLSKALEIFAAAAGGAQGGGVSVED
jgi:hypothetical protein